MTSPFMAALPFSIIVKSAQAYSAIDEQRDIFESHRHHIFSVAYYMTGDEREAESILSATFVRGFQESPRPSAVKLDQMLMEELRGRLSLDPVPEMPPSSVPGLGARNVRRTDLEEALWQMPGRERLCFLLRDVEGYLPAAIAELLKISEGEVQRTLLSARLRMRSLLIEQRMSA